MSFWMKKKLEYTDNILAGLTSEDYEHDRQERPHDEYAGLLGEMGPRRLAGISPAVGIFQSANRQLIEMADEENLDGAAIAYVQLTLSCVNCHKVVRDGGDQRKIT